MFALHSGWFKHERSCIPEFVTECGWEVDLFSFAHTRKQRLNEYLSWCFIKTVLNLIEDTHVRCGETDSLLRVKKFWKPGHWLFVVEQGVSSVVIATTQTSDFCDSWLIRPDMKIKCYIKNKAKKPSSPTQPNPTSKTHTKKPNTVFFSFDIKAVRNYVFSCLCVLSLIICGWSSVVSALDWLLACLGNTVLTFPSPRSAWRFSSSVSGLMISPVPGNKMISVYTY